MYHKKKSEGLAGSNLHYYHPYCKGGYWEQVAIEKGEEPPWKDKQRRAEEAPRV